MCDTSSFFSVLRTTLSYGLIAMLWWTRPLPASEIVRTSASSHAKITTLGLSEVRWTAGFWADRFATCRDHSIPAMWELMRGNAYKPFLQHFLIAAGKLEGEHHGAKWNDGDFYKWMEAATATLAVQASPELSAILDRCVAAIGAAQRSDGYLHTPVLIARRNGDLTAEPFRDRHNFEMYNMGHLITAATLHHRVTGKEDFLAIAKKTAAFLDEAFSHPTPELARNSVCPSHYMAMVELYRTTQDPKHLELAKTFLEMRNIMRDGGDDNQDRIPFVQQREAIGHAVRANYLFAGAADVYLETGDPRYWKSLNAIWQNVTQKKLYVTGGCGALYDGASPDGSPQQTVITRVHQSYGRNYQLPNTTAHNETCAAIGSVLWNWRMFLATGESRYMDLVELTLLNSVLCGVDLAGTNYFYTNPLRNEKPLPVDLRWSRTRVPFVTSYCCPPNVVRTIAQVNGYAYSKQEDAVMVNLYGGNRLRTQLGGEALSLEQTTAYPWQGTVTLTMHACPQAAFGLQLRIPHWCDNYQLRVNGTVVTRAEILDSGYVEVRRQWKPNDELTVTFDMPTQLIESHPLVEETRNQVAVKRGPLVYCLESSDLPEHVRVRELSLAADSAWKTTDVPDLAGITGLETEVVYDPAGDWTTRLYRPLRNHDSQRIRVRFVPYFAWSNRGESEMSVWIPLHRP